MSKTMDPVMIKLSLRHFLCVLLTCTSFSDLAACFQGHPNPLPDISSLCPHRQFCNGTEAKNISIEGKDSCCQICSCAPDCHTVGSCCPDVKHLVVSPPTYPCRRVTDMLNSVRNMSLVTGDKRMYRFIDDCPDKNTSALFPACEYPVKLQDFVIVSDKANQKVFKNRHCAMCHGVADFNEWELTTWCEEVAITNFQTFQDRDNYILQNCMLNSFPPNKLIHELATCFYITETIQDCHGSNLWTEYGDFLKTACHKETPSQNTVYFMDDTWKQRAYKNVFCYLCSQSENAVLPDICTSREYKSIHKHTFFVTLLVVLSPSKDMLSQEVDIHFKCKSNRVWDPFVKHCRALFCPIGKIPMNGECMSTAQSISGLSLNIQFEVILKGPQPSKEEVVMLTDSCIPFLFSSEFKCGVCKRKVYTNPSSHNLFFQIPFFTTRTCSLDNLLTSLKAFVQIKKKKFAVKHMDEVRHLIIEHTTENILNKTYLPIPTKEYYKSCSANVQTDLFILQNCPRILITTSMFQQITQNDTSVSKNVLTEILAIKNDNNTVFICFEEYLRLTALVSCSGGFPLPMTIVSLLALHFTFTLL